MPSLERIEQFHEALAQLGDEPAIAADRGEIIEPPAPPESAIDDDLSALLGDAEADSELIAQSQAAQQSSAEEAAEGGSAQEDTSGEDTAALLSSLDDLFNEDEDAEQPPDEPEDDPFASLGLGDEDFPEPPDFTFDPDSISDEIPEDEIAEALSAAGDEPAEPDAESLSPGPAEGPAAGEPDTEGLGDLDDLGDLGDLGGLDDLGEADAAGGLDDLGEAEELDEAGDLDDLGDLGDLGEADDLGDEPDLSGLDEAEGLGDLDALGDLDDLGGLDDLGEADELDEADDLGETDDLGGLDDLDEADDLGGPDDLGDLGDLDDLGDEPDLNGLDDADGLGDLDALGDLDDLGGLDDLDDAESFAPPADAPPADAPAPDDLDAEPEDLDTFDDDFGAQVDSEFGDDPFSGDDDDAFELPSVDDDLESLEEEGFSLGDFGEEFDIDEESIDEFAGLEVDDSGLEGDEEDLSAADHGIPSDRELSDKEFAHLQQTLSSLPLNVKIAAEETIAEGKGTAEQINQLIDALIAGAAPTAVADLVSKITGTRLQVPKGYQKRTGLAFEEERRSLRYRFVHVILPVLRVALLVTVAVVLVGFLSYRFVYRPIHAAILYRQGYTHAQEDRFQQANETFERAWELNPRTRWFSRYARVYVEKRQYDLAVEKYDQLVFGMDPEDRAFLRRMVADRLLDERVGPVDRRGRATTVYHLLNVDRPGILEHAQLQSEILANYQRAEELYSILLYEDDFDYDGLMGRGDNFLRWAEEDPDRYEDARLAYADLLAGHGDTDAILMRFLRFFVRTDNRPRVDELVDIFERQTPDSEIEPEIYTEAAGYLLDHGVRTDVRNMLLRSFRIDPMLPEIHYHLARYNRLMQASTEERNALDNARAAFELAEPLSPRHLRMQIDTDIRSAEYWYLRDEILQTIDYSERALSRYEEAKEAGLLAPDPMLSRVYAVRGNVEYYTAGDLDRALNLFNRAVADGYSSEDLSFRRGFISYELERFDEAIERFYEIGSSNALEGPENLIYARANTLFRRGNYVAAEAMYRRLRRTLQARRDRIQNLLVGEDPEHRALIEYLYRVNNNLGVALFRQTEVDTTRPELFSEALTALQESAEIAENYLRDPDTGQRPLARNLAYLNIRGILNPTPDYTPQIFQRLPRDMDQVLF